MLKGCITRCSLLLFTTVFVVMQASSQLPDYHLKLFDYSFGIRPGNIIATTRDHDGFLWILYPRSVQRFDGKYAKTFNFKGSLEHIFCDNKGRIWVNSAQAVFCFVNDYRGFREVPVKAGNAVAIGAPFYTLGKELTLFTRQGICYFDETKHGFLPSAPLSIAPPYSTRPFTSLGQFIFFLKDGMIYRYNVQTNKADQLLDKATFRLLPLNEDSALVSTWDNHSYWYDFKKGSISPIIPPKDPDNKEQGDLFTVRSLVQIKPHLFLLTAREGIYEYDNSKHSFRKLVFFHRGIPVFTNDFSNHAFVDKQGYCWLSTNEGVARFSTGRQELGFIRITKEGRVYSGSLNNVRKIVEDKDDNLWLATGNGFVGWIRKEQQWTFFPPVYGAKDRLGYPSVRGMVYDGKYLILGPTNFGLWLFDPVTHQYRRPQYEKGKKGEATKAASEQDFIDDIFTIKNGSHLIMGRDALYVLDGKTYTLRSLDVPPAKENTNYAFQTGDGVIWLTTGKGLHCFDSGLNYLMNVQLPFKNKFISCGFATTGNRLLFACAEGLFTVTYNGGKPVISKFTNVFDNIFLATIYQDNKGVIWASSESGIYRYDPATSKLNLMDHSDNVQGYGFNGNSWFRSRTGYVFLGGNNGINYLQPETFGLSDDSLNIFIETVKINNNDTLFYSLPRNPQLRYDQQSIEVEFGTAYFNNHEKIRYRYLLEGYDEGWKNIEGNTNIRFTSLPPGSYTLRLQASLNGVNWIEAKDNFPFVINAPFWKKWWFYALCFIATGVSVYRAITFRNKKIQEQKEELEQEQVINYFASSLYQHQTVEAILWDVAYNCISRLHFEDCVIYLLDEDRNVLVQKAAYGPKSPHQYHIENPIEIPPGQGITGAVALTGVPEMITDTTKDPRYIVDDQRRYSEITVPIVSDGKVLGIIDSEHSKKGFFTQKHLSVLTTMASLCANKIVRLRAEEEKMKAEQVLVDTKQKMAEAEMQALRAQMNPHFIFNCLNSINRYIVKSDQQTASLYLTRFAKLIRLILDNSHSKNVLLSSELEALKLYIDMEALRFDKKFSYHIAVDEDISTDSIEVPPLIIQPYVENAIWHGLLHKQTVGHLHIHLRLLGSNLQCVIEDNGVGREKAKELRSKSVTTKKSLGMKLTEDRLILLNKHAQRSTSIDIIDLKDERGEALGTKVILLIPI